MLQARGGVNGRRRGRSRPPYPGGTPCEARDAGPDVRDAAARPLEVSAALGCGPARGGATSQLRTRAATTISQAGAGRRSVGLVRRDLLLELAHAAAQARRPRRRGGRRTRPGGRRSPWTSVVSLDASGRSADRAVRALGSRCGGRRVVAVGTRVTGGFRVTAGRRAVNPPDRGRHARAARADACSALTEALDAPRAATTARRTESDPCPGCRRHRSSAEQRLAGRARPLGDHLDPAVVEVERPAGQPELERPGPGPPAEADPLHPPAHPGRHPHRRVVRRILGRSRVRPPRRALAARAAVRRPVHERLAHDRAAAARARPVRPGRTPPATGRSSRTRR